MLDVRLRRPVQGRSCETCVWFRDGSCETSVWFKGGHVRARHPREKPCLRCYPSLERNLVVSCTQLLTGFRRTPQHENTTALSV